MKVAADNPVCVLVVDDEPAVRTVVMRILASAGYEAEGAGSALEAHERLGAGGIDVVLCDLRLGDTDGLELIRDLATYDPAPAAVAVTGQADRDVVAQVLAAGAAAYVTKPFKASDIEIAVQQALLGRARADSDPLTGLFNRRRFGEELERHLRACRRNGGRGALLACDLDHFRLINDSRGHAGGDAALRRTAEIIQDRLCSTDVAARVGGDEFAVLLSEVDRASAMEVARELQRLLSGPAAAPVTGVSIGVATFDGRDGPMTEDLLHAADAALDDAKQAGRNTIAVYGGPKASSLGWVDRIRAALDDGGLEVHTQPIVDVRTGELRQEELLVRMRDASGELVPPASFLPTAERFGLIERIDGWMLARALELAAAGRSVNVNISAPTLHDGGYVEAIAASARAGVDPRLLTIEITETMAVSNIDLVRTFATRLVALGCGLALDDFGTGFGTLTYLKHLPITAIKIDRDFVGDLASDSADRRMIKAIVEIAAAAGQTTVAEGVENAASFELLKGFGVDRAQGYYVARPALVSDELPQLLHPPRPTSAGSAPDRST